MISPQVIDSAISAILAREGGYVDRAEDKGGPTNHGITLETLVSWRFPQRVTTEDVRRLSESEARDIYRALYVTAPKFHELTDPRLFSLIVDSAANHGPTRATKWLQTAAAVEADGFIGSKTLAAVQAMPASKLYKRVLSQRLKFYAHIVANNADQRVFIEGWINRGCEFIDPLELPL